MNIPVLSDDQILRILSLPDVLKEKDKLILNDKVYFQTDLDNDIKQTILDKLGLNLFNLRTVPMRWIKGDTPPHIDKGPKVFQNTFLIYLQDSQGEFIIDNNSYPIQKGSGFVFSEGLSHETKNTGSEPRLLIGPMSEFGFSVGSNVSYFSTFLDAQNFTNILAGGSSYTVGTLDFGSIGLITIWKIAPVSSGTSDQTLSYPNGSTLNADGTYNLYPSIPCFLEGSTILCISDEKEVYVPIENIKPGTLVKTSENGFKKVELIGTSIVSNNLNDDRGDDRLYICKKEKYPELKEDLIITGHHCILVDNLSETQREKITKSLGKIYITGKKYRLPAFADERAEPWQSEGKFNVWHLALENDNIYNNYGIYSNGGLLVETTSIRYLRDLSNMKIIQ